MPVGTERPLGEVAREIALDVLGSGAPPTRLRMMEQVIHDVTTDARRRGSMQSGVIFWPDATRFPPIADINLTAFYPPDPSSPPALEHYREMFGTPDEETIGPIETTEVDLPLGPALRFHRRWARKKRFGSNLLREDITYAVRPPQIDDAVCMVVSWVEPQYTSGLIKIADKSAQTLRIKFDDD
jgi:hypothetical protein